MHQSVGSEKHCQLAGVAGDKSIQMRRRVETLKESGVAGTKRGAIDGSAVKRRDEH